MTKVIQRGAGLWLVFVRPRADMGSRANYQGHFSAKTDDLGPPISELVDPNCRGYNLSLRKRGTAKSQLISRSNMRSERLQGRFTRTTSYPRRTGKIRLIIADDHPVVREGLGALVKSQPDMTVVSEATDGRQAVQQFLLHRPDVVLLDLRMPGMNGIEALHSILEKEPKARIIILSTYGGDEDIRGALKAGAKAYLLKDSPRDQLLESIRAVYEGRLSVPPVIGAQLAASMIGKNLTDREREVLSAVVAGKSNKEIGSSLGIMEGTVKVHMGRVFKKLGAAGRTEAVRIALKRGFVHLGDSFSP